MHKADPGRAPAATTYTCDDDTFGGDPVRGGRGKKCECKDEGVEPCDEGSDDCVCESLVRFGTNDCGWAGCQSDQEGAGMAVGFVGRIAYVQVFPDALSSGDASCIFGHSVIEACDADAMKAAMLTVGDSDSDSTWPLTSEDPLNVELSGNPEYHAEFGLRFDGDGDVAWLTPPEDYTADASFTISFWASQTLCTREGTWENLYLHYVQPAEGEDSIMWWQNEVASVAILMTCWGETPHIQAQVKSGTVNAGLNVFAGPDVVREGGYETTNWVSFGLSVAPSAMGLYIDGMLVPINDATYGGWGWQAQPADAEDKANTNAANPVPSSFPYELNGFSLTGGKILLGGDVDSTVDTGGNFEGSLFHLTIFPDALDIHQHDCLYQQMEATVATCSAVNGFEADFMTWRAPDGNSWRDNDVFFEGGAYTEGGWGLTLDGDGDHAFLRGSAVDIFSDATFGISFWFTKPVCNAPGRWQFLLSQMEPPDEPISSGRNSGINLYIGCAGWFQVSTVEGDIVRAVMMTQDRKLAIFDIKINGDQGGALTDTWTHLAINVHPNNQTPRGFGSSTGGPPSLDLMARAMTSAGRIQPPGGGGGRRLQAGGCGGSGGRGGPSTTGTGQRAVGAFAAGQGGGGNCPPPANRRGGPGRPGQGGNRFRGRRSTVVDK